ncbi:MAG TPA: DNA repair protein RadC [Polyangia bacterium]
MRRALSGRMNALLPSFAAAVSFATPATKEHDHGAAQVPLAASPGGTSGISDLEVVATLLGHGRPRAAHFARAQEVLVAVGGLSGLGETTQAELVRTPGLGPAVGSTLAAALELGRRTAGRRPARNRRLATAPDVYEHYRARLGGTLVEEFWALGLDVRHRLIFETCVARGSLTGVEVHPRDVYRPLIRAAAAAVIFCHNHPSGDPSPSRQDLELTARLKEVGTLCGITLLDHVVVGSEGYVSFAERGWL